LRKIARKKNQNLDIAKSKHQSKTNRDSIIFPLQLISHYQK